MLDVGFNEDASRVREQGRRMRSGGLNLAG
jgi:hypothetical protein